MKARDALWRRYIDQSEIDAAALVSSTAGYTPADVAHVARAVAQSTFERSIDSGTRCYATTQDYLCAVEVTRPTVTPDQASAFEADIEAYART